MTNGDLKLFQEWKNDVLSQLDELATHLEEVKRDMVTRKDFEPLQEKVRQHDEAFHVYRNLQRALLWVGVLTVMNILFTTHWTGIASAIGKLTEFGR